MTLLAWDIGGAHLKAARVDGSGRVDRVLQWPCPLWQGLEQLRAALAEAARQLGAAPRHAVTMTGEMADCFANRAEGVLALADCFEAALPGGEVAYYSAAGFLDPAALRRQPLAAASANWHASAALAARALPAGLLVDMGSTTTDLVPFSGGLPRPTGHDDHGRLVACELVYTGLARTPLMAVAQRVHFEGVWAPTMAEHFATSADVHRILGTLPEGADEHPAADGGPKTRQASMRRLARMLGRDLESAPESAWEALAGAYADLQLQTLSDAALEVLDRAGLPPDAPLVTAGVGAGIARRLAAILGRPCRGFGELVAADPAVGDWAAFCAPAVAVGVLRFKESFPSPS